MPRIARTWGLLVGLAACSFDAPYAGGHYTCNDGKCPSGLMCSAAKTCVAGIDAASDGMLAIDARPAALTCGDPGLFPAAGGTTTGTTVGRADAITSMCGATVTNGPDAVYRVDTGASAHVMVTITGSYAVNAYLISPCAGLPSTPQCESNLLAAPGNPITVVTAFAGQHFVIVDGLNPTQSGTYTLRVAVTP